MQGVPCCVRQKTPYSTFRVRCWMFNVSISEPSSPPDLDHNRACTAFSHIYPDFPAFKKSFLRRFAAATVRACPTLSGLFRDKKYFFISMARPAVNALVGIHRFFGCTLMNGEIARSYCGKL